MLRHENMNSGILGPCERHWYHCRRWLKLDAGSVTVVWNLNWMSETWYIQFPTMNIVPLVESIMEMGSLWERKTSIENPICPLNCYIVWRRGLDLSKEVLWVSVGQRTAKLQAVKVGDQEKFLPLCQSRTTRVHGPGSSPGQWNIFKVWWTITSQPFDLKRLTIPL